VGERDGMASVRMLRARRVVRGVAIWTNFKRTGEDMGERGCQLSRSYSLYNQGPNDNRLEFEMGAKRPLTEYAPASTTPLGALRTRLPSYQYHSALSNTSLGNGGGGNEILMPESEDLAGRMAFHVASNMALVQVIE
jgi:hypothetical protein